MKSATPLGKHIIRFKKIEYTRINTTHYDVNSDFIYTSPPAIAINVIDIDERTTTKSLITIDDFVDYGMAQSSFTLFGHLNQLPAETFRLNIALDSASSVSNPFTKTGFPSKNFNF